MNIVHATDETFRAEVLESSIPVLVDFFTEYCGPCQILKPTLHELAELHGKAKIVMVDAIQNPATATTYSVSAVPTLIMFKNGEMTERVVGLQSKDKLVKLLSDDRSV